MGASPVCRPGLPEEVPVVATPAVPVGVFAASPPALTTVTAVTTDWLPLGSVLVCTTVLVVDDWVLLLEVVEPPAEGVMVWTPPPTVETMVRPTLLVLVTTSPFVREAEVPVADGDAPAEVELDGLEPVPDAAATPPLEEVLVEVVLGLAAAGVVLVAAAGLGVVLDVSPP